MLLPVVLIFSFLMINAIVGFSQSLFAIHIYEKELAARFLADFHALSCVQIMGRSLVSDPYLGMQDFEQGISYPIWPADGNGLCTYTMDQIVEGSGGGTSSNGTNGAEIGVRVFYISLTSIGSTTDAFGEMKKVTRKYKIQMKFEGRILDAILIKN